VRVGGHDDSFSFGRQSRKARRRMQRIGKTGEIPLIISDDPANRPKNRRLGTD